MQIVQSRFAKAGAAGRQVRSYVTPWAAKGLHMHSTAISQAFCSYFTSILQQYRKPSARQVRDYVERSAANGHHDIRQNMVFTTSRYVSSYVSNMRSYMSSYGHIRQKTVVQDSSSGHVLHISRAVTNPAGNPAMGHIRQYISDDQDQLQAKYIRTSRWQVPGGRGVIKTGRSCSFIHDFSFMPNERLAIRTGQCKT